MLPDCKLNIFEISCAENGFTICFQEIMSDKIVSVFNIYYDGQTT